MFAVSIDNIIQTWCFFITMYISAIFIYTHVYIQIHIHVHVSIYHTFTHPVSHGLSLGRWRPWNAQPQRHSAGSTWLRHSVGFVIWKMTISIGGTCVKIQKMKYCRGHLFLDIPLVSCLWMFFALKKFVWKKGTDSGHWWYMCILYGDGKIIDVHVTSCIPENNGTYMIIYVIYVDLCNIK